MLYVGSAILTTAMKFNTLLIPSITSVNIPAIDRNGVTQTSALNLVLTPGTNLKFFSEAAYNLRYGFFVVQSVSLSGGIYAVELQFLSGPALSFIEGEFVDWGFEGLATVPDTSYTVDGTVNSSPISSLVRGQMPRRNLHRSLRQPELRSRRLGVSVLLPLVHELSEWWRFGHERGADATQCVGLHPRDQRILADVGRDGL